MTTIFFLLMNKLIISMIMWVWLIPGLEDQYLVTIIVIIIIITITIINYICYLDNIRHKVWKNFEDFDFLRVFLKNPIKHRLVLGQETG